MKGFKVMRNLKLLSPLIVRKENQDFQIMVPRSAEPTLLENLLEMQIWGPHTRPAMSEILPLDQVPQVILPYLKDALNLLQGWDAVVSSDSSSLYLRESQFDWGSKCLAFYQEISLLLY